MVICKYFLRGTCRFGESCKNEHSCSENSGSIMRKTQDIDTNVLLKSISNDMEKAEIGHQWPFTCYGPFQGKPCFPGFEDKSFEEIRLAIYEAEKTGTLEQYKQQLTQILNEIRLKMRSLQNPTPDITNVLKQIFNIPENQAFSNNTNSIFGNNASNHSMSIFGNQNVFATPATNTGSNFVFKLPEDKNVFTANNPTSSSIFAQANTPAFSTGNNIFGGGQTVFANTQQNFSTANVFQNASNQTFNANPGSLFGNKQINQANIFAQNNFAQNLTASQSNPFQQNSADLFAQNNHTATPFQQNSGNIFTQNTVLHQNQAITNSAEHTKNIFGSMQTDIKPPTDSRKDDGTIYSKLTELNEKDIKCFEATSFNFGQIPENPPPLEMC